MHTAPAYGLREAARILSSNIRPEPHTMARLIEGGLEEATLHDAWDYVSGIHPTMDLTLKDHTSLLPYVHSLSDTIADQGPDRGNGTIAFAARDAEVIYDDFQIRHPDKPGILLPASSSLMRSKSSWDNYPLARDFLAQHGLGPDTVKSRSRQIWVVDSGFAGTIGVLLDKNLNHVYGGRRSLLRKGRMVIKLVSDVRAENYNGIATRIMDMPFRTDLDTVFPKATRAALSDYDDHQTEYTVATALQIMPRYHGAYERLATNANGARAIPKPEQEDRNIDFPNGYCRVNQSIVNRLAAAVIQFRTVQAALEKVEGGYTPPARQTV